MIYTNLSDNFYDQYIKFSSKSIQEFTRSKRENNSQGMKDKCFRQLSFVHDPMKYFEYFDYLFLKNPIVSVVGDITPAYAGLPSNALSDIQRMAEKFDFNLKIIFIMRDPVDRLWSAARHIFDRGTHTFQSPAEVLTKTYKGKQQKYRAQYDRTIESIEQSEVDKSNVLYLFYESLFKPETIDRIADFLGCNLQASNFDQRVNQSSPCAQDPELSIKAANYYRKTYEYILDKFGYEMRTLWPSYELLQNK